MSTMRQSGRRVSVSFFKVLLSLWPATLALGRTPRASLMVTMLFSLLLSLIWASSVATESTIQKRDSSVCNDLSVSSNNGDRKVAIVIDSSGSMAYNDYDNLRIAAGRALNEFLISSSEASGSKKADLVTVIDFDTEAYLDYPLGDPGGANASFSKVDDLGGTYIAAGVNMAIKELTGGGGATDKRSAIVIFTDGEDAYTDELVWAINNATAAGIRVSFGYLDTSASYQPTEVLSAIKNSRGVYATITVAAGSQNYINYVLLNGLTYNDNPQGYDAQLLAGLAETHFVTGSETVTLKYSAQKGENVNFTITSISAGELAVTATMGGKTLNSTMVSYFNSFMNITAPSSGEMGLKVTAKAAPQDAMFSVMTGSNVPFKNCTVGVTGAGNGNGGLSKGAKAGIGIGVTAALVGILGLGGYFLWKHFYTGGGGNGGVSAPMGDEGGVQYVPGMEKPMATTSVYPIDPSNGGHALTSAGDGIMAGPGQAPMSAPNLAPAAGNGGIAPFSGSGGLPAAVGSAPMSAPVTGGLATAGNAPFAFVPPLVPPNVFAPKKPLPQKGNGGNGNADGQALYTMHNQAPQNGVQQTMGPGGNEPVSPIDQDPMGYGNQPLSGGSQGLMAYGSQVPLGSGGGTLSNDSQAPMGGQAPLAQYLASPENFHQNAMQGTGTNPVSYDPNNGGLQQYNPGFNNGALPGQQSPMSPDSFNHGMDSYNNQPVHDTNNPMTTPNHPPDYTDYHDPDACSCSDGESLSTSSPETNPGFTMPGAPYRSPDRQQKHKHTRRRFPRLARSRVEKHHHHPWLGQDVECTDEDCPLNKEHVCVRDGEGEKCACKCREEECPVYKRKLRERRHRDGGLMGAVNAL